MNRRAVFSTVAGLGALMLCPFLPAAEIHQYDWITAGEPSGSLQLEVGEDGQRTVRFEFNDRGRGPMLQETTRVDGRGLITQYQVSGNSYMGAKVDESFERQGDSARWQSTLEQGESSAEAFYTANDGTPEQIAVLARALLNHPKRSLALFPAGTARIENHLEYTLKSGAELTLYSISGLDLAPEYFWLDSNQELYALALGWTGMAPPGQAKVLEQLQAMQDKVEAEWHQALAKRLSHKLPENWVLRNVTVLDVESGQWLENRAVAVSNGKIIRIAQDKVPDVPITGDMQPRVLDGQGQYLVPGLWDMHTHLSLNRGLLHIAAGVTSARDLANNPERLDETIKVFDSGEVIGPRVFKAGFIDGKSPYSAPTGSLASTADEAVNLVQQFADQGYPQIKIYSSIEPEWVKPIAQAVHDNGMRLSGHIPSYMSAEQAILAGYDEIQHINMLFLNFLAGPEDDTRTPLRFSLVAEKAADLDLDSKEVKDFIALLKARNIVVDPTVTIFEGMFTNRAGAIDPSYAMIADHLPPAVRRQMLAGEMDISENNAEQFRRSKDVLLEMVKRLHRAGVTLVPGTDALPGFTLHRELELYHQAGISSADVLRIATIGSARVAGAGDHSGSIEVGKDADFVLLGRDPLQNISAVRRPTAVFKADRWFDSAELYESVGIRPFTR